MDGSKGSTKRITVRANPAQTVILKGAFTQSSIISPQELKTLSEKTGLPEKWIHLWFGRQRVKARKAAVDLGAVTSNSDLVLSPQDILDVKMEHRNSLILRSSSPAVPNASLIAPASDGNISQSEKAPPKKKARVSQGVKKKQTTVRNSVIKAEYTDPVVSVSGNLASAPPSTAQSSIACDSSYLPRPNGGSLVTQPALPFRRIAPPSRTPISANILAHSHPENWQSGLFTNQSYRIYSPLGTTHVTTVNVADSQPPPGIFESSKAVIYQQGPRFHTHFHNNGPANYRNTRSNLGTELALRSNHIPISNPGSYNYLAGPMFDLSRQQNMPNQVGLGGYFSQFLAPAIVLESTSKPMPSVVAPMHNCSVHTSSSSMQYAGPSTITEGQPYHLHYSGGANPEDNDVKAGPKGIVISAQYNLLLSRNEALDPSLAPLKHLTDILERFRDQDGTYTKLVDLKEREGLMNCLLDDELARRSPFQAAMGLVLLSKLGLEWDY